MAGRPSSSQHLNSIALALIAISVFPLGDLTSSQPGGWSQVRWLGGRIDLPGTIARHLVGGFGDVMWAGLLWPLAPLWRAQRKATRPTDRVAAIAPAAMRWLIA